MATYVEIPYGGIPGVGVFYGDRVPTDAANIAYVQTIVPPPGDVIDVSDDLSDATLYPGNNLIGSVKTVQFINGVVVDPLTNSAYVGLTDNTLFTTVTAQVLSRGVEINVPLFYCQELRFPISAASLPASLAAVFTAGIPPNATSYVLPSLVTLGSYVRISTQAGDPVPSGYVWQVLPVSYANGSIYIRLYTNFRCSLHEKYIVSWAGYTETLNVHPVFFQGKKVEDDHTYTTSTVYSQNSITKSTVTASGSPTVAIVASSTPPSIIRTQAPVAVNTNSSIIGIPSYTDQTYNISVTNATPSYIAGSSAGLIVNSTAPAYYTFTANVAPTSSGSAISLNLLVSASGDNYGQGELKVELLNNNNQTIWGPTYVTANQTIVWWQANALASTYTWSITPTVNTSKGNNIVGLTGTYSYPITYSGTYSYATVSNTTYNPVVGAGGSFSTAAVTVAPSSTPSQLTFLITSISTPIDGNGSTGYTVNLYAPNGSLASTWTPTGTGTLAYAAGGAASGTWTWKIVPTLNATGQGTGTYKSSIFGNLAYYIPNSAQEPGFLIVSGNPVTYTTNANTVAPTSFSNGLSFILSSLTTPSSNAGSSSLAVDLVDPYGKTVQTWFGVSIGNTLTYNNPAAAAGSYIWQFYASTTDNNIATASFTVSFSGQLSYYQPATSLNSSSPSAAANLQPIGFNFGVGTPNGTGYVTVNDGAQIFVEEPDNLDANHNWYLRIHRGWLSYTDSFANTFLVGLAPYYQQNFKSVIPLIYVSQETVDIIDSATVRVRHTPVLWSPTYPVDIIVTRGGSTQWLTRDDGTASGVYTPAAITDCYAEAGEFTLANAVLQNTDLVQVNYTYLEYYYTYRGMPDTFGRFVHLDVNPTAPHKYMNLWNITNTLNTLNFSGYGSQTIATSGGTINAPRVHTQAIAASGSPALVIGTATSTAIYPFTNFVNYAPSLAITASQVASTGLTNHALPGQGASSISLVPSASTATIYGTELWNYTGSASTTLVPSGATTLTPASITAANTSSPSIFLTTTTSKKRVSTGGVPFSFTSTISSVEFGPLQNAYTHTWSNTSPGVISPVTTSVIPDSPQNMIDINFSNLYYPTFYGGQGAGLTYPYNSLDNSTGIIDIGDGTYPYTAPPVFFAYWSLTAAGITAPLAVGQLGAFGNAPKTQEFQVYKESLDSLPNASNITASPLSLNIYHQGYITSKSIPWTSSTWDWSDDIPIGNPSYLVSGTATITSIQTSTSNIYSASAGSITRYPTTADTTAPVNSGTELSLTLSSIITPSNANGSSFYTVVLTDPVGQEVQTWTNVTSANNTSPFTYYNANAIAGVYTWTVFAQCTSNSIATTTFNCSASITASWTRATIQHTGTKHAGSGKARTWTTPVTIDTPSASGLALSMSVSGLNFQSDSNGYTNAYITLVDPSGDICNTWNVVASGANTLLSWYSPNALKGAYTWHITPEVQPLGTNSTTGTYTIHGLITFGYYVITQAIIYTTKVNSGTVSYRTEATTIAPTNAGTQLTFNLTQLLLPSDAAGAATLTLNLYDPNNALVLTTSNFASPITYSNSSAIAGIYTWVLTYSATPSGNNQSGAYLVRWYVNYYNHVNTIATTYPAGAPVVNVYTTNATTLAPTGSSVALTYAVNEISMPSDTNGSTSFQLVLKSPSGTTLQTWTLSSTPTTYTYTNAAAVSGAYTWNLTASVTSNNTGISTYHPTLRGQVGIYQLITNSSSVITEMNGNIQNFTVPALNPTANPISMFIGSVNCANSGLAQGYFSVTLSLSGTVLQTWSQITRPQTLTYSGGTTGNYTWKVQAFVTNPGIISGTFNCSMLARLAWTQNDAVPVTVYYAPPYPTASYKTGPFTVPPISLSTAITLFFTDLSLPADKYGSTGINVNLYGATGNYIRSYMVSATARNCVYYSPTAGSGDYTFVVQPYITPKNTGTNTYLVSWSATMTFTSPIDDEEPTVQLIQKAIYLYLTVDGYPFHAVLNPNNNPLTPLAYDTNNALVGTRYASMPTIHSF